jgi:iron complex transport system substrate-binding protein
MGSIGRGVALTAALCALAGGCGESPPAEPRPQRIVSLSPTATETLFAIGAGEQVVAVDSESDHPAGVPRTDLSSYEPNVEAIAGYRPDLVVVPADIPPDALEGLRRLRLTVIAQPAPGDLEAAYDQMRDLGEATGRRAAGEQLARAVRARVARAIADAPRARLKVFHELDPDLYSASSETFIGRIYARLGLRNIADRAADRSGAPYPQLSAEGVLTANPDLIVLADSECCDQTPERVRRRAGWGVVAAVREGAVVSVDDDIASRWGPRIPEFVEKVAAAMEEAG